MNLDKLKALVTEHSEKPLRFPEDTPESFWLGYDAATFDFLRLLDEEIAWGEKGTYPGDFIIELSPMVSAGRGTFKPATHKHVINMLPKLIERVESAVNRSYEMYRPNIKVELRRARSMLDWAEAMMRSLNAKPVHGIQAHTHNPEYAIELAESGKIKETPDYKEKMDKMEALALRARTFVAENVGSTEYRKFDDGSRKRDHAKQTDTGGME